MRSVLVGTVPSTKVTLDELARQHLPPCAVLTVDQSLASRNATYINLVPSCDEHGIPVETFRSINAPEVLEYVEQLKPDIAFVIGLSQLISESFLSIPKIGCLGFHPAALPKNRGRAVIPWTIIQGVSETAATLFWIDDGVDSGPIAVQRSFSVSPAETARSLLDKHLEALRQMLRELIPRLRARVIPAVPQDGSLASWCAKRELRDGIIDWRRSADEIWTLIRAVGEPYHGALTEFRGRPVTIWSAEILEESRRYWGVPGQVQAHVHEKAAVMCGERGLLIPGRITYRDSGEDVYSQDPPRIHERFGGSLNVD